MSPDRRPQRSTKRPSPKPPSRTERRKVLEEAWGIEYFQRHEDDDPSRSVPAREFLAGCPKGVSSDLRAVVTAVADAPPPKFSGGGQWKAMHDSMRGWYEARMMGPGKRLYRVFCLLERAAPGLDGPSVVLITGMDKPNETAFSEADYARVRALGDEYRARSPRSVLP